jgi:hypothetical protein
MEPSAKDSLAKPLSLPSKLPKILLAVIVFSLIAGSTTGYLMANKGSSSKSLGSTSPEAPKVASQDSQTFRDFAEGTIKAKAEPKDSTQYTEGTHILEREGAVPVALTSSVVDLSEYEGKKVKVYGETQKALKEGWLMDVGKVEEL